MGGWREFILGCVLAMLMENTGNPLECLMSYLYARYPDTFFRPQTFMGANIRLQDCHQAIADWIIDGTERVIREAVDARPADVEGPAIPAQAAETAPPYFGIFGVAPIDIEVTAREMDAFVGILLWAIAKKITKFNVNSFLTNRRVAAISIVGTTDGTGAILNRQYPTEPMWQVWCARSNLSVGIRALVLGNIFLWASFDIADDHEMTWATVRLLREHGVSAFGGMMNLVMHAGDLIESSFILTQEAHAAYPYLERFALLPPHEKEFRKATMGASYVPLPKGVADNLMGAGILYTTAGQSNGDINRPVRMNSAVATLVRQWLRDQGYCDPIAVPQAATGVA
jgi:hypothetical protein